MQVVFPPEIFDEILRHAQARRTCVGIVARSVRTGRLRVVRMKSATVEDVRRVYRELNEGAEYIEAIYRGAAHLRPIAGIEDEGAPYLLIDARRQVVRSVWVRDGHGGWREDT